jgi:hypothetical protein
MNEQQFVLWMRGFVTACHSFQPTPAQWDELVETLNNVNISSNKSDTFELGKATVPESYWKTEASSNSTNIKKAMLHG